MAGYRGKHYEHLPELEKNYGPPFLVGKAPECKFNFTRLAKRDPVEFSIWSRCIKRTRPELAELLKSDGFNKFKDDVRSVFPGAYIEIEADWL